MIKMKSKNGKRKLNKYNLKHKTKTYDFLVIWNDKIFW